jgi:hypothetical protein
MEKWQDIPGYKGLYQASNKGQIKSLERTKIGGGGNAPGPRLIKVRERILRQCFVGNYLTVNLSKNGKASVQRVHSLVALTFLGDITGKHVNHKNSLTTDNHLENLEIVTAAENVSHSIQYGSRIDKGQNNNNAKLAEAEVLEIRERLKNGESRLSVAVRFGVKKSCIDKIATQRTWKHL